MRLPTPKDGSESGFENLERLLDCDLSTFDHLQDLELGLGRLLLDRRFLGGRGNFDLNRLCSLGGLLGKVSAWPRRTR